MVRQIRRHVVGDPGDRADRDGDTGEEHQRDDGRDRYAAARRGVPVSSGLMGGVHQ
ncbi:hypothetical protein OHA63_25810 [Streptomyces anulatus]|uniref:hypothetical protein n=1 Tax=Streptomyces anulatus TaxID=1892 RepID=UPI002E2F6289|nr:hypothetical protein [Streptomyces anulatus]